MRKISLLFFIDESFTDTEKKRERIHVMEEMKEKLWKKIGIFSSSSRDIRRKVFLFVFFTPYSSQILQIQNPFFDFKQFNDSPLCFTILR
jgi:hypothetical protein